MIDFAKWVLAPTVAYAVILLGTAFAAIYLDHITHVWGWQ